MTISANKVVTLAYTLTDDEGVMIDQSDDGSFKYLHGAENIVPGLESALDGQSSGSELNVVVEPADGYGERNDTFVETVPRTAFSEDDDIQVGMQFHAESAEGDTMIITVIDVDGDQVTIDGNHPLAGVRLNFQVKVMDIRDATAEELEHGHVHGAEMGHVHGEGCNH